MNNQKLQELIKTEQRQILNYLTNVNVTGLNTYKQNSQTNTRIYDVNAERKTIWNLDTYTQKYLEFLQFMNTEFTTIYEKYKTNSGDIFTSHLFDNSEGNAKILEDYKEIYKANFKKEPKFNKVDNYKNNKEEYYPHFETDIMSKTRKLQYEKVEKEIGITVPIQEQTEVQFLDTIVKRIEGLLECSIKYTKNTDDVFYFKTELINEINLLMTLLGLEDEGKVNNTNNVDLFRTKIDKIKEKIKTITNENAKSIVKEHCKSIFWGVNDSKYNKDIENEDKKKVQVQEFKNFIESNPIELKFLKTFMIECFEKNKKTNEYEINWDIVKYKMGDRTYRQMCFGYTPDIKIYEQFKSFFEVLISNEIYLETYYKTCSYLIIWSIFMNFYFSKCAITNTDIEFPIRFKLPIGDRKKQLQGNNTHYSNYKYELRAPSHNLNIFEDTNKIKFIGFINIKFYYEKINVFRNWTLFIYNNNNLPTKTYIDYMTGQMIKYPIFSHELELVNEGSIVARDSASYEEIKFFKKESEKENNNLFIYISTLDNETLFITPKEIDIKKDYLQDLNLERVMIESIGENITTARKDRYIQIKPRPFNVKLPPPITGGNLNTNLKLKLTDNISIFNDILVNGNFYSHYLYLNYQIDTIERYKTIDYIFNFNKQIYKYFLVSPNNLSYSYLNIDFKKLSIIPKYNPVSTLFFHYNELFINYNIFNKINHKSNILCIGAITPVEVLKFKNYKLNKITYLNYHKLSTSQTDFLNVIKNIYEIDIIDKRNESLFLLPSLYPELYNTFSLNIYSLNKIDNEFYMLDTFYNVINIFIGALVGLKYTALDGIFILNLNDVITKSHADIYLILKPYFKESHLYYPEISNMVKLSGVYGIFKGFKGIPDNELKNLETIFEKLKKEYPNNMIEKFNVYDTKVREHFNITKPIEPIGKRYKYIDGFFNISNNKLFEDTYKEIIEFNTQIYLNRLSYVKKLVYLYENNINFKVPTQDQILSSILYCRKYNIPIFDKYTITKQNKTITNTILNELYGLHEPIILKFKTPYQTTIANKIMVNPKFKHIQSIKKSSPKTKNKHKTIKNTLNNSFFNSLFENNHKSSKYKSSKHKSSKHKSKKTSKKLKHTMMSLEDAIFESNNSIEQVGRLMDVRKDFTKSNPNELYDTLKEKLRFYKGPGKIKHIRNVEELHLTLSKRLNNFNISQAWIKMYEIIMDCDLVPTNRKGVFKSFHICEAPGAFISCINHYIHTKTQYNSYEWKSQSLNPKGSKSKKDTIGDTYGFIKKYPNHWDFGIDDTGDITNIENIKYYAKMAKEMNINLMTSDCGLPMGDTKYLQVAYASYVSLLYSLPKNGTLLYKILSPIDTPLLWNLIYMTYRNFKEMYFFKPVQNSQSREFYIIGKGYLGTEQSTLDKLLNLVDKFDNPNFNKEEYDLYNDTYPEEFVIQVQHICEKLSSNYVNSIERIIYYIDNIDELGKDYQKHIESYIAEKNEDWIRKYKPLRLDKKFSL